MCTTNLDLPTGWWLMTIGRFRQAVLFRAFPFQAIPVCQLRPHGFAVERTVIMDIELLVFGLLGERGPLTEVPIQPRINLSNARLPSFYSAREY